MGSTIYSFLLIFLLWSTGLYSCLTTWVTHFSKLSNPPNRSFLPILLWHHTTTCPQIHICIVHCIAGVGHGLSSHRGGHCPLPACSPSPGSGLRATPPRNIKWARPRWVRALLGIHTQINSATNLLVRNKEIKIPGNHYKGNPFNLVMSWIEYLCKIKFVASATKQNNYSYRLFCV